MASSDALLLERERWKSELEEIGRGSGFNEMDSLKLREALFFVKWSEIRKDAAKMLQQYDELQGDGARMLFHSILEEMDGPGEMPWQKVHGAMLGINAILSKVGDLDRDVHEKVKSLCLRLQGNSQMLVRTQVHKFLVALFTRSDESERLHLLDGFLTTVISLIKERLHAAEALGYLKTPSPSSSKSPTKGFNFESNAISSPRTNSSIERTAYILEGTLGIIHSIFEQTPELFQLLLKTQESGIKIQQTEALESVFTSLELSSSSPARPSKGNESSTTTSTPYDHAPFYLAIAGCLGDISSTVRQAAAQALLALVDRCDMEKRGGGGSSSGSGSGNYNAAQSISKIIYNDLTTRLNAASSLDGAAPEGLEGQGQSWLELEACLLISEGLVKNRIEVALDSLMEGTATSHEEKEEEEEDKHIHEYLTSLHAALGPCVLNPAFEIKRAGTQVVPLLARLLCLRHPTLLFQSPAIGGAGAMQGVLGTIYAFYWVSEVTKASQHMREVVAGAPDVPDGGMLGHGHPEAHAMWALEVAGRLGEEENKMHFRQRLRSLVPDGTATSSAATGALVSCLASITQDLREHLPRLLSRWETALAFYKQEEGEERTVVALDVAEASALAAVAVCGGAEGVHLPVLQAWTQSPELISHLLRTTSGRYRDRSSPTGAGAAMSHSGPLVPVLIIPSVADPGMDPSALLTPRRRNEAAPNAGLTLGSPRSVLTAGIGMGGGGAMPAVSPRSVNATNRHFCEMVAPVLPMLSILHARSDGGTQQLRHLLTVGQLCTHWLSCCLSDAQFLERRQHVRNGLCASLGTFLHKTHELCKAGALPVSSDAGAADDVQREMECLEQLLVGAAHIATEQIMTRGGGRGSSAHDALICGALARSARLIGLSIDLAAATSTSADGKAADKSGGGSRALRVQLMEDLSKVKAALSPSSASRGSPARRVVGAGEAQDAVSTNDEGGTGGNGEEEDEFSDWDESSEELNISVNSISAIREEDEAEHCLQEIESTLAFVTHCI